MICLHSDAQDNDLGAPGPSCGAKAKLYRQCHHKECAKEIGYCKDHGGDERAVEEMILHIESHG